MPERPSGGCFCGAVRFEIGEIFDAGYCHCSICRRFSGAPLVVWTNAPGRTFEITAGEPKRFASSDPWVRHFCSTCARASPCSSPTAPGRSS